MRLASLLWPLCSAPLLASCIFLLDYEELQSGAPASAGGAAGQPSASGGEPVGGAGPSCGSCDDGDPCTIDTCVAHSGAEPTCQHATTQGLKLDGFETSLTAERHVRVALVGAGTHFYLSALEENDDVPTVSLYRLALDGTELEPMASELLAESTPMSNIGLAVEELPGGQAALHGFVAVKADPNDAATRVLHLESRGGSVTSETVGLSYRADAPTVFPQALAIGGDVVAAWIQEDGTIAVHSVGDARTDDFGDVTLPATTLALLSSKEQRPAVLFTAQGEEGPLGVWVEPSGGERSQLLECETAQGAYLSSSVLPTPLPGTWLANVARQGDDYPTSSGGTLVCSDDTCVATPSDCDQSTRRNVAGATVQLDTDGARFAYSVVAVAQLAPKADGTGHDAKLTLVLSRADLSQEPAETSDLGTLEVAKSDSTKENGFAGPDWPAVALLPAQRAAVAWIAPRAEGAGTELRIQRYKLCLGPPEKPTREP